MSTRPLLGEYVPPDGDSVELRRKLGELRGALDDTRAALRLSQQKIKSMEQGLGALRQQLAPLYQALGLIFGELNAVGVDAPDSSTTPRANAAWEKWIHELGGNRAAVLTALLEHGEMTRVQLRIASHVPDGSLNSVTSELGKLGLINRGGGKYSLKEL